MWPETGEQATTLRTGLTTGTCATACCVACARALLAGQQVKQVLVTLPKGRQVALDISYYRDLSDGIVAATIKDAGDDPDVTHGATVFVELRLSQRAGVQFNAAAGVGQVTRPGLSLAVGEAAINPVPRDMMRKHLHSLAAQYRYLGGFDVAVGVENGEQLALKTMNARLGIIGGLSILGTTGIVRPYSCAAYVASIHQGIDVARANNMTHIAAATGNSSETAIKAHYQLVDMALIEMGDFAGAVLKYLRQVPIQKVSLCGGFGKISKLAQGHLNLNSRHSSIDFQHLAQLAQESGANNELCACILSSNTSVEALQYCQQSQVDLGTAVCRAALVKTRSLVPEAVQLEVWAVDRLGHFIGHAGKLN